MKKNHKFNECAKSLANAAYLKAIRITKVISYFSRLKLGITKEQAMRVSKILSVILVV